MRRALGFAAVAGTAAILIGLAADAIASSGSRGAVWLGVGAAFAVQFLFFVGFSVYAFASQPLLAHLLGMFGRFLTLGVMAFIGVPWAGVPAAPFLVSAVAVFFATTLLEPLFLFSHTPAR